MKISALACLWCGVLYGACELPSTAPQAQTAQSVFDDLVQAAGQGNRPDLAVLKAGCLATSGPEKGAWYDEKNHRVTLDVALVDLCGGASLGGARNCLAFLLGHELAHAYREHYRTSALVSSGGDASSAALERDADLFGGIYGYRAGYDSLSQAPQVLEAVYGLYKLQPGLRGYPELAERKRMAQRSLAELRHLIPLFETGNLLFVISQYSLASDIFEDLSRKFPSREMFNNLGVSLALQIASLRDPKEIRAYPWMLDSRSRLELAAESSRGNAAASEQKLFDEGKSALERAKSLDEDYVPAYLNLACLYDLHRAGDRHARLELDDAVPHAAKHPGLEATLKRAAKILDEPPTGLRERGRELDLPEEEQIGDMTAAAVLAESGGAPGLKAGAVTLGPVKEYEQYSTMRVQGGGRRWAFVTANAKYAGKTNQGVRIGSSGEEVNRGYCAAGSDCGLELQTAAGHYLHFKKARIVFVLQDGRVVKWILYAAS